MKRVLTLSFAALAVVLTVAGCYGRKLVNVPNTVDLTRAEIQALRKEQEDTNRLLSELRAKTDENGSLLRELKADTGSRFEELGQRIQVLEGKTDDTVDRFERLSEKVDEVRYPGPTTPLGGPDSLAAGRDSVAVGFAGARKAYTNAYTDMTAGNYDLALMGFEEFLRNYPDSELSDNAQYWIGECHYAKEEYQTAYDAFKKVLDVYPKGDKIPSALLKTGYCALALGKDKEGRAFLKELVAKYPLSAEARLAQEKLDTLPR
jgi:tol-pal system protein YbgF